MTRSIMSKNVLSEDGFLVATAMIVMSLMLMIGLATYAIVGTQQAQSRVERERDSSFNLSESALYAEAFIIGKDWPTATNQYPTTQCTHATAAGTKGCPTPTDLQNAVDSSALPDLARDAAWTIRVRDNGSPTTRTDYDSTTNSQPSYDANGDGKLWVRADGWAKGRKRSIVGLLQLEQYSESTFQNVITAGHFVTSNSGNKVIVDTQGSSATGSQVVVRCTPGPSDRTRAGTCMGYDQDKGQVSPDRVLSVPSTPNAMTQAQLDRFKAQAIANDTYYDDSDGCPDSLTGSVVFVETSSTITCSYNGGTFNAADLPGVLIFTDGNLTLGGGKVTYYGLVYMLNPDNSSEIRFTMHANGTLQGGVSVDGNGGVDAGSDKFNIIFDGRAFASLNTTIGAANLVQNSWRELPAGTP